MWQYIYSAWRDLKIVFSGKTQKAIIAYISYNEQIVHYAYEAALNESVTMTEDIRQLIGEQEGELKKINDRIEKYGKVRYSVNQMAGFNNEYQDVG
ncbi:hypothetical protein [Flavipsychrobacter stenotrophus]|uniref:hypothetical protein n=1 Tax=Flavipsychrobacter stenotrophus TaxID=2077091 RepID=UPI0010572B92|nr:hypothetical protein [Flavipsychrobacter stenotrophus]